MSGTRATFTPAGERPPEAPQDPAGGAPARRRANPLAAIQRALTGAQAQPEFEEKDMVDVTVPKAFMLIDDGHLEHAYGTDTARMPRKHAEHWYAKANGVQVKG